MGFSSFFCWAPVWPEERVFLLLLYCSHSHFHVGIAIAIAIEPKIKDMFGYYLLLKTENILTKYTFNVNSIMGPNFKVIFLKKSIYGSREQCIGSTKITLSLRNVKRASQTQLKREFGY